MKMLRLIPLQFVILLVSFLETLGLDVEISSVNCTKSLPVYATDFQMLCNGDTRCTFGETATIYGLFVYNGVEDSGVVDNVAYITSDLDFVSLDYHLFQFMPVQLCYDGLVTAVEDNDYGDDCPADGEYWFEAQYDLPTYDAKTSWLATGWKAKGEISMYATENINDLIGYCTFNIKPMVTRQSEQGFDPPSAAATAGIIGGVLALALAICLYCTCRAWCKKDEEESDENAFKRMDGSAVETKTEYSGGSSIGTPDLASASPSAPLVNASEV